MQGEDKSKADEIMAMQSHFGKSLSDRPFAPLTSSTGNNFNRSFYELNLRKIELELHNEQLLKTQEQLEASNKRYSDLYDALKSEADIRTVELARAYEDLNKEAALRSSTEDSLAQNAARFAAIFDSMSDAVIFTDTQRRIVLVNPAATALFGHNPEELVGQNTRFLFAAESDYEEAGKLCCNPAIHHNRSMFEVEYRRKDGTAFPAESLFTDVKDSQGNVIGFLGIHRDISIRKNIEAEKERRFSQMYSLLRASQTIFSAQTMIELLSKIVDAARLLTDANLGVSGHMLNGEDFFIATSMHQGASGNGSRIIKAEKGGVYTDLLKNGSSIRLTEQELQKHPAWWGLPEGHPPLRGLLGASLMGPDGKAMGLMMVSDKKNQGDFTEEDEIILMQLSFITSLGLQHIMAKSDIEKRADELRKSRDLLEQKVRERTRDLAKAIDELKSEIDHRMGTEEKLISSRQKLRNLYAHLQSTREVERTRIAREIHDELGQVLTALKMDLAWTRAHIPKDLTALLDKTDANVELVDRTIQSIKRIITELRPGILDHLGLGAAIEWQSVEFEKRTGIPCHVKIEPAEISIEPSLSIALFRIFQEALTNIARHANATMVKALLRQDAKEIRLEVADNGIGISEDKLSQPKSFGLMGMRERVHQFSGDIRISGKNGSGTTLTVTIPLTGSLYDM